MTIYFVLIGLGLIAGFLSGAVGFGGGMIIIPVITYYYGIETAIPISTLAQLLSNLSKMIMGIKQIVWKQVGRFLILAAPLTALGAFSFTIAPKLLLTQILCVFLILFAIIKLTGKIKLPATWGTMLLGGGLTGFINGTLGISGPLSSAVFLTLNLSPVAYIASEATAATAMHLIKIIVYGKFQLMDWSLFCNGLYIGLAMIAGNFIAIKTIKRIKKKVYQRIVASVMIAASIWLFISVSL